MISPKDCLGMNKPFLRIPNLREVFSRYFFLIVSCILYFSLFNPVFSNDAVPLAQSEATEKRMVEISSELRCLVCQNESLSGSHAELASDLRREIRTQITAGKNDNEIMDFMVSRYGDFIRYRPPLKSSTILLWFGPALLFLGSLGGLILYLWRRTNAISDKPLNVEEQEKVERLLNNKGLD